MEQIPRLAIVILNWNGRSWLERFLPDVVRHSQLPGVELMVADNASTDDSVAWLQREMPQVRVVMNQENGGFAAGYNQALKHIRSENYLLLNSDVAVQAGWLEPMLKALDDHPHWAALQPKIRSYNQPGHFEYAGAAGGFIDRLGYPFCRGRLFDCLEEDTGQYNNTREVFWATGACMLIRSEAFWKVKGFDEEFFAHMEEIDLCWRLKRCGYGIGYCAQSVVHHVGGGTLSALNPKKTYLKFRNNLFILTKNLPNGLLYLGLFQRMMLDGLAALRFLLQGEARHFKAVWQAHMDFYQGFGGMKRKRSELPSTAENGLPSQMYKKLLIVQFFGKGLKRFSQLNPKHFS